MNPDRATSIRITPWRVVLVVSLSFAISCDRYPVSAQDHPDPPHLFQLASDKTAELTKDQKDAVASLTSSDGGTFRSYEIITQINVAALKAPALKMRMSSKNPDEVLTFSRTKFETDKQGNITWHGKLGGTDHSITIFVTNDLLSTAFELYDPHTKTQYDSQVRYLGKNVEGKKTFILVNRDFSLSTTKTDSPSDKDN